MLTLLASQIYPVLLLVFSLFTAASTGPKNTFYSTEAQEQTVKENVTDVEENVTDIQENNTTDVQMLLHTECEHVIQIP
jgi:hypothetical protein